MNYIHQLQTANQQLSQQLADMVERVRELEKHITLPKYQGNDMRDGQSNAWISTRDIANWTRYIIDNN